MTLVAIIVAWTLFFGFLNTHQRHASGFKGESQGYLLALNISGILGVVAGLAFLVFAFLRGSWYDPLLLFAVGSFAGAMLFGIAEGVVGSLTMSMAAFLGWPLSLAACFYMRLSW